MAVLPPSNFLTLHYVYFVATCMVTSIIFYLTSTPWRSIAYVDALFLCVSAMTGAGLNTVYTRYFLLAVDRRLIVLQVDLSTLNSFQQAILFVLLLVGSPILVSSTVLMVRKRAFESKLKGVSDERERERASRRASAFELELEDQETPCEDADSPANSPANSPTGGTGSQVFKSPVAATATVQCVEAEPSYSDDDVRWIDDDQVTIGDTRSRHRHHHSLFPMAGVGARPDLDNHPDNVTLNVSVPAQDSMFGFKRILLGTQKYFASKGLVSRNSQFHGLTSAERETLGGVEYKAVSFLSVIVPLYYVMFVLCGIIGMGWWLEANHPEIPRENGLPPFFTGAFFAVSAFVNSGMSLLDVNMTALQLRFVSFTTR